jgi:hypothetical protein
MTATLEPILLKKLEKESVFTLTTFENECPQSTPQWDPDKYTPIPD